MCVSLDRVDGLVMSPEIPAVPMEPEAIVAEGRVLDAVAAHDLRGTVEQLADVLGVSARQFRDAVSALSSIGWVEATYQGDGGLVLCLPGDLR